MKKYLLLLLLLIPLVNAQSLEIVPGNIIDNQVSHVFTKSEVSVFPETARSSDGVFEHNISFKNTENQAVYVYFDPYFSKSMKNIIINEVPVKRSLNKENKTWGSAFHYHTTEGLLVEPNETVMFELEYEIKDNEKVLGENGKWFARLWANTVDDWTCALDINDNCLYDVAIDPSYELTTTGGTNNEDYWSHQVGGQCYLPYQTFKTNNSGSFQLTNISVYIQSSPAGNTAELYVTIMDDWDATGAQLGTSDNTTSDAMSAGNWVMMNFSSPPIISGETFYIAYLRSDAYGTDTTYVERNSASDDYANGTSGYYQCSAGTHTNTTYDLGMKFYYEDYTPPSSDNTTIPTLTYNTNAFETTSQEYLLNVTWVATGNVSNVTSANLTLNNTIYGASIQETGSNWTSFNVSDLRLPLVNVNNTNLTLNWTYNIELKNGLGVITRNTSNQAQGVYWAFMLDSVNYDSNITETSLNNWEVNTTYYGENEGVTIVFLSEYNITNITGNYHSNYTNITQQNYTITTPFIDSSVTNHTINITPIINISFDGVTITRNLGSLEQTINLMLINDCSEVTGVQAINYTILDEETLAQVNGDLNGLYEIWLTDPALNRSYAISSAGDSQPEICIFPYGETYQATKSLTYSSTGYGVRTQDAAGFSISNVTSLINLYLLNSSSATAVTITVVDQDDNPVVGGKITLEKINATGASILVGEGITDFNGQHQFQTVSTAEYLINISSSAGDLFNLTSLQPASVGPFQILTTTLTFRVLTSTGSSLQPLIDLLSMNHSLTFNNGTGIFTLGFSGADSVASNICLEVYNMSDGNMTLLVQNCSTSDGASLTGSIGGGTGNYLAQAVGTSLIDAREYIFDTLGAIRAVTTVFGQEGVFWSLIIIVALASVGLVVTGGNPVGAIVGSYVGLLFSTFLGLIVVSAYVILGLAVVGGIIIVILKT